MEGVLASKDFTFQIIAPTELVEFTELVTAPIVQKMTVVLAPQPRGEEIINKEIPFVVKRDGKEINCGLHAHLWLDTENAGSGRVSIFSKGVRVYKSILELDEPELVNLPLWQCRQIRGYVEDPYLKLTIGREKINTVRESNFYKGFIKALTQMNTTLWPEIASKIHSTEHTKDKKLMQDLNFSDEKFRMLRERTLTQYLSLPEGQQKLLSLAGRIQPAAVSDASRHSG